MAITDLFKRKHLSPRERRINNSIRRARKDERRRLKFRKLFMAKYGYDPFLPRPKTNHVVPPGTLLNWTVVHRLGTRMFWHDEEGKLHSGPRPRHMPWWYQGETYEQAVARVKQDELAKQEEDYAHRRENRHAVNRQRADLFARRERLKKEVLLRSHGRSLRPRMP